MLGCGIRKRLLLSFIFFLMMVMHYACVQSIAESESEKIEILNTSIELDRFGNELFFQVETNQNESQVLIHSVAVELTYTGDNIHEYSETFQLYDNGENGDIIASNGIYTLRTNADMVVLPEIEPEIIEIDMPDSIQLHETEEDSMDISVIILGKTFNVKSEVINSLNKIIKEEETVNLDNSDIEIYVNDDFLFKDRIEDNGVCFREQADNPNLNNYWLYNTLRYGSPSNTQMNQFYFNQIVRFKSVNDCGGYGKAYFKFKLIDWDTDSDTTTSDIELLIYGCGDTYCTSEFENKNTCPEDCQ